MRIREGPVLKQMNSKIGIQRFLLKDQRPQFVAFDLLVKTTEPGEFPRIVNGRHSPEK